jgi:hypothetical protein
MSEAYVEFAIGVTEVEQVRNVGERSCRGVESRCSHLTGDEKEFRGDVALHF